MSEMSEMSEKPEIPEKPEARWYVVHTYSGYENKVKANIEKIVENRGMKESILEVVVPMQEAFEIKNGKKMAVQRKIYPGYVLLKMIMDDDTWYVVRNTRGVTSFVGPGSKPVPLSDAEVASMGIETPVVQEITIDFDIGDLVDIMDGPFAGSIATVREFGHSKRTVIVNISMFGRDTPVELEFTQVKKYSY